MVELWEDSTESTLVSTIDSTPGTFSELGLSAPLLRSLADEGYTTPTPIQAKAIPHILDGRDLFGCAQTGTGKTAAFALPLIEQMRAKATQSAPRRCRTLVLAPTRELAAQIHESFLAYGRHCGIQAAVIYGGVGQQRQARAMLKGVDVLVATPGRLLDLITQRLVDIRQVEFLVLDEADRMLDMGFIHDMRRIIAMLPTQRQTLFFSATLPKAVRQLADSMLQNPLEIKTAPQSSPAETVSQSVFHVPKREKKSLLIKLLQEEATGRVIVFARTKHGADKLQRDLTRAGIPTAAIHGNKSQPQRERALAAFKSTEPPVLVATDIAARGIDVDEVAHVINYELPHEPETYVHRIGRTGRAGQVGAAVSFCDPEEQPRLVAIERLLRRAIPARNKLAAAPTTSRPAQADPPNRTQSQQPRRGKSSRSAGQRPRSRPAAQPQADRSARAPAASPGATPLTTAGSRGGRSRHRRAL